MLVICLFLYVNLALTIGFNRSLRIVLVTIYLTVDDFFFFFFRTPDMLNTSECSEGEQFYSFNSEDQEKEKESVTPKDADVESMDEGIDEVVDSRNSSVPLIEEQSSRDVAERMEVEEILQETSDDKTSRTISLSSKLRVEEQVVDETSPYQSLKPAILPMTMHVEEQVAEKLISDQNFSKESHEKIEEPISSGSLAKNSVLSSNLLVDEQEIEAPVSQTKKTMEIEEQSSQDAHENVADKPLPPSEKKKLVGELVSCSFTSQVTTENFTSQVTTERKSQIEEQSGKEELSEISAEEIAECLQDKVIDGGDALCNLAAVESTAAPVSKEEIPSLCFSDSEEEILSSKVDITLPAHKDNSLHVTEANETLKPLRFSSSEDERAVSRETITKRNKRLRKSRKQKENVSLETKMADETLAQLAFSDDEVSKEKEINRLSDSMEENGKENEHCENDIPDLEFTAVEESIDMETDEVDTNAEADEVDTNADGASLEKVEATNNSSSKKEDEIIEQSSKNENEVLPSENSVTKETSSESLNKVTSKTSSEAVDEATKEISSEIENEVAKETSSEVEGEETEKLSSNHEDEVMKESFSKNEAKVQNEVMKESFSKNEVQNESKKNICSNDIAESASDAVPTTPTRLTRSRALTPSRETVSSSKSPSKDGPARESTPTRDLPSSSKRKTPARETTPSRTLRSTRARSATPSLESPPKRTRSAMAGNLRGLEERPLTPSKGRSDLEERPVTPTKGHSRGTTPLRETTPSRKLRNTPRRPETSLQATICDETVASENASETVDECSKVITEEAVAPPKTPSKQISSPGRSRRKLSDIAITNVMESKSIALKTPTRSSSRRAGGINSPIPILAKDVTNISSLKEQEEPVIPENSATNEDVETKLTAISTFSEDKSAISTLSEDKFSDDTSVLESALPSPARRGRRSSVGGKKSDTPSTPVRRSSRRSMTPSKIDATPTKKTPASKKAEESAAANEHSTDVPSARRGRRRSVDSLVGTPVKATENDGATPSKIGLKSPFVDPLDVIEEKEESEENVGDTPEKVLTPLQLITNARKKSKRLSVAPALLPITEDAEMAPEETTAHVPSNEAKGTPTKSATPSVRRTRRTTSEESVVSVIRIK